MAKGVGVYIGRNEVVAVSVLHSIKGPQIKGYAIEPITPDTAAGGEPAVGKEAHQLKKLSPEARAIRKALEKIKEPAAYVTAAVSPSQVATRHFIMPAVPKKEEANAVNFEANRYIPFKLTESVMSYNAYTAHKNVLSVTATAVKKEILGKALEDLHAASCKVLMVEPAFTSVIRAYSMMNLFQKTKTCGFLIFQSDGNVNLTFVSKGVVYLSRDFLLSGSGEEVKKLFFDELKASLDYFYKLTGGEAVQHLFLAGQGDLKYWAEYCEQAFNYSIRFDLAKSPNEENVPSEVLGSVLVAFGLAIRALGYASPVGEVELLPASERRSKPEKFFGILGGIVAGIFVFFLLVRLAVLQPFIFSLQNQSNKMFGPESGIDSSGGRLSNSELSKRISVLGDQAAALDEFMKRHSSTADILAVLGKGLPPSISFDYISVGDVESKKGKSAKGTKRLTLRGTCYVGNAGREAAALNAWVKTLSEDSLLMSRFSDMTLEETKREKLANRQVTNFRVVCQ